MMKCKLKDANRIDCSRRKSSEVGQRRRKVLRAIKKGFLDKNTEQEGEMYVKGGF